MPGIDTSSLPISRKVSGLQARLVLGVSEPTFLQLRQRPDFPKPYRITPSGRRLHWDVDELLAWQEATREKSGGDPNAA